MSEAKALLRRFFETVIEHGELDRVGEFFTADTVNHMAPEGGQIGLEALKVYFSGFTTTFSDMKIDVLAQVEEDGVVMSYVRSSGTQTGDLPGLPATGRRASMMVVRIDRFENGKIAEHWSVSTFAEALAALAGAA